MDRINRVSFFLASPSDVAAQRAAVSEVVDELKKGLGTEYAADFHLTKCEDVLPGIGGGAQEIINYECHPGEQDIFVAVFDQTLGTPTIRADSGTVEEYEYALKNYKESGNQQILLYFRADDIGSKPDDSQQKSIRDFKRRVSQDGVLYSEYNSVEDFKEKLRINLTRAALRVLDKNRVQQEENKVESILKLRLEERLEFLGNSNGLEFIERWLCPQDKVLSGSLGHCMKYAMSYEKVISHENSVIIRAPKLDGLTVLAKMLVYKAYAKERQGWVYLDYQEGKLRESSVRVKIKESIVEFNQEPICLVVDNWSGIERNAIENLHNLLVRYPDKKFVVLQSTDTIQDSIDLVSVQEGVKFDVFTMLPLQQKDIRSLVSCYTKNADCDVDGFLQGIISDFNVLNVHRSPLSCRLLIKASEYDPDKRPVNRAKALEKVLRALFCSSDLPTYSSIPNADDCELVLGAFCEHILKENCLAFKEDEFRAFCVRFCADELIALEIGVLWNALVDTKIIVRDITGQYVFRYVFWVSYFAAQRMRRSSEFKKYVLTNRRYAKHPEILEFYTGLSEEPSEVLDRLAKDVEEDTLVFNAKLKYSGIVDPLQFLNWRSDDDGSVKAKAELERISQGTVMTQIEKDEFHDNAYDYRKPYVQDVNVIFEEISFARFVRQVAILSRALRNCESAPVVLKKQSLRLVVRGWCQVTNVLYFLAHKLVDNKDHRAKFLDFGVCLAAGFSTLKDNPAHMYKEVLLQVPINVMLHMKDDLASERLGLLYKAYFEEETNQFARQLLADHIVLTRPMGWCEMVREHMKRLSKNSGYLFDIFGLMKYAYRVMYMNPSDVINMRDLLTSCMAKHWYNSDARNHGVEIEQNARQYIPERNVDDESCAEE